MSSLASFTTCTSGQHWRLLGDCLSSEARKTFSLFFYAKFGPAKLLLGSAVACLLAA
jgi:hypothetical protein